ARDDDTKGVDAQGADCDVTGTRAGWTFGPAATHHVTENDTSAFKRKMITLPDGRRELRTVRPGFRQALAMLADGRADGLMAYDLDRAVRDPRDLEDLIDVVEGAVPRIPVESVTGSLRLANDSDITMARVMVAVANKASRDTARRGTRGPPRGRGGGAARARGAALGGGAGGGGAGEPAGPRGAHGHRRGVEHRHGAGHAAAAPERRADGVPAERGPRAPEGQAVHRRGHHRPGAVGPRHPGGGVAGGPRHPDRPGAHRRPRQHSPLAGQQALPLRHLR